MRLSYTHTIRDELHNIDLLPDFECEIDVSVERDGFVTINGVYVEGKSLFSGTALARSIAGEIANDAETKLNTVGNPLRERVLEREAA